MRALTIRQLWASLIICDEKDVENRTWTTAVAIAVLRRGRRPKRSCERLERGFRLAQAQAPGETQDAEEKNGSTWRLGHGCDHGLKNAQRFVLRRYGCLSVPKARSAHAT